MCSSTKVLLVGDSFTGKTSMLRRYSKNEFLEEEKPTFCIQVSTIDSTNTDSSSIEFWDSSGQEKYAAVISDFYCDAVACLVVYDITRYASFQSVAHYLNELHAHATRSDMRIVLVGNKCDQHNLRTVTTTEGEDFARQHSLTFFESSALTSHNVVDAFASLLESPMQKAEGDPLSHRVRNSSAAVAASFAYKQKNQRTGKTV